MFRVSRGEQLQRLLLQDGDLPAQGLDLLLEHANFFRGGNGQDHGYGRDTRQHEDEEFHGIIWRLPAPLRGCFLDHGIMMPRRDIYRESINTLDSSNGSIFEHLVIKR